MHVKIGPESSVTMVASIVGIGLAMFFCIRFSKKFRPIKFYSSKKQHKIQNNCSETKKVRFGQCALREVRSISLKESTGFFSWAHNPRLVMDAAESGWGGFTFTFGSFPPSRPPHSRCFCAGSGEEDLVVVEISWEILADASDYSQKIRLLPRKGGGRGACVQAALPLPGPQLDPPSFPSTAYFEITITDQGPCGSYSHEAGYQSSNGSDRSSTSSEKTNSLRFLDCGIQHNCMHSICRKLPKNSQDSDYQGHELRVMSVGFAANKGGIHMQPGLDSCSVGLHSSGYVLLNGVVHLDGDSRYHKLSTQPRGWGGTNTVIGCGFDPENRTVFYTMNGEMVYSLTSRSEEFRNPMYPTVAANYDVTLLINYGQSHFEYDPANSNRVIDPCFRKQYLHCGPKFTGNLNEDSADLFSIGELDSRCLGNALISSELFEIPIYECS